MDRRVAAVITLMEDNLHRKIRMTEMTQVAQVSTDRLRQIFKAETGLPPIQYLRRLRLLRARQLLESSSLSVKEVAAHVGLNDVSHFVRDFRRVTGSAPTAHRTHHLDGGRAESRNANSGNR